MDIVDNVVPDQPPVSTVPDGVDVAALATTLAAVQAELAGLKAAKDAEEATKADKIKAEMSEMDRLKADLAEQRQALAAADAAAQAAARDALLDSLGVDPKYRRVFPDGDYRDARTKAAAEKYAADHPRLVTPRQSGPTVSDDLAARLLTGRKPGSLIDPRAVQASLEALNNIKG